MFACQWYGVGQAMTVDCVSNLFACVQTKGETFWVRVPIVSETSKKFSVGFI
jgi:hypothetical protein